MFVLQTPPHLAAQSDEEMQQAWLPLPSAHSQGLAANWWGPSISRVLWGRACVWLTEQCRNKEGGRAQGLAGEARGAHEHLQKAGLGLTVG